MRSRLSGIVNAEQLSRKVQQCAAHRKSLQSTILRLNSNTVPSPQAHLSTSPRSHTNLEHLTPSEVSLRVCHSKVGLMQAKGNKLSSRKSKAAYWNTGTNYWIFFTWWSGHCDGSTWGWGYKATWWIIFSNVVLETTAKSNKEGQGHLMAPNRN